VKSQGESKKSGKVVGFFFVRKICTFSALINAVILPLWGIITVYERSLWEEVSFVSCISR